ncbi:MAG TPA: periplasmic heavy metal sensor, partial [Polyangiaceae bacterium]|nr:periplasmic heavy metal sensor [Polyangiaceae bacterium]
WMTDAQRDELRPRRRALRGSRHAVEDALRAEPFDREKLGHALGELRRQTDDIQASVHQYMLQRAEAMSGDERRRLADSQWPSGDARDGR